MPARRKPDPGWVQIQRERYGPDYRIPSPHRLHVAGDLVGNVLKKFGLAASADLEEIRKAWLDTAGKVNADHSSPGKLEKGTLTIYMDHHVWLNEMKRVVAPSLLKKLQQRHGNAKIKRLRFEITPEEEH